MMISFLDHCGDHVIVINSSDIALPGDEWDKRVYFHHTGYPGGATWTLAYELHSKDPTMVVYDTFISYFYAVLHIFVDYEESCV